MKKQVEESHYSFGSYVTPKRWMSIWNQLDQVLSFSPSHVLEIGPGRGLFKAVVERYGIAVETVDIDSALAPDYVAKASALPLPSRSVDVACAFQVLEHMPFKESLRALSELCRVARKGVVLSLPDCKTRWPISITVPRLGLVRLSVPRPFYKHPPHAFDGQHYWEIGKRGYELPSVTEALNSASEGFGVRTFSVHEHPYHRFFVFTRE